jgi:hypothetical protein
METDSFLAVENDVSYAPRMISLSFLSTSSFVHLEMAGENISQRGGEGKERKNKGERETHW